MYVNTPTPLCFTGSLRLVTPPGKQRVFPFFLGNWIAGFKGKVDGNFSATCFPGSSLVWDFGKDWFFGSFCWSEAIKNSETMEDFGWLFFDRELVQLPMKCQ